MFAELLKKVTRLRVEATLRLRIVSGIAMLVAAHTGQA
jgi:hypothetical protein